MSDLEFEAALLGSVSADWISGFVAGWQSSGEGFNGEYPDEGVLWEKSAGRDAMLREIHRRVMPTHADGSTP
jgi:hypothetical protein